MIRIAGAINSYKFGPIFHPDVGDGGQANHTITHNLNTFDVLTDLSWSTTSSPTAVRVHFSDYFQSAGYSFSRGFQFTVDNANQITIQAFRMTGSSTYLWGSVVKVP